MRRDFPFLHPLHRLTCALRRLGILSQTEGSLWISFSAFFRADPCLQLLKGLEQDLRKKVQRMTVRGFAPNAGKYLTHAAGCPGGPRYNSE